MKHRISAGAFVVENDRILLVRHMKAGRYDFWVAPGGGAIDAEGSLEAAVREAKEETGMDVAPVKPVYLEEFFEPRTRHIKTWIWCTLKGGDVSVNAPEAVREHIAEARFFSKEEIQNERRDVFPEILKDRFWSDLADEFPKFEYIGLREMAYF